MEILKATSCRSPADVALATALSGYQAALSDGESAKLVDEQLAGRVGDSGRAQVVEHEVAGRGSTARFASARRT